MLDWAGEAHGVGLAMGPGGTGRPGAALIGGLAPTSRLAASASLELSSHGGGGEGVPGSHQAPEAPWRMEWVAGGQG